MTLAAGTRLGPYEILSPLGAGGMGEVYRAHDGRLKRDVAIKVLASRFADHSELRERFEREARAIARVTHPNICTLYDVGSDGGATYLVMELLEGTSLADRLDKGSLPTEAVLARGIEIARALDRAHRAGIVHRDLKPGNVMLTRSGVKLLDFGLAKAVARDVGEHGGGASHLPTQTATGPLTGDGAIMGTVPYMSPEQLEGKNADARSDVFALGCVLHEMATGRRAFPGESQAAIVTAIMSSHPPAISAAIPSSPPALDHVVRRCLAKDPEERWQSAADVAAELQWIGEEGPRAAAPSAGARSGGPARREIGAWIAFAAAAAAAIFAGALRRTGSEHASMVRLSLPAPARAAFGTGLAVSPDGLSVAFVVVRGGTSQIWIRPFAGVDARALAGTDGAVNPFWSPDGRSLAYLSGDKLRRIEVATGAIQNVCDVANVEILGGGSWSKAGFILFAPDSHGPIFRVPAGGGTPVVALALDPAFKDEGFVWPEILPDGRHFLVSAFSGDPRQDGVVLASLDSKDRTLLVPHAWRATFAGGALLFTRQEALAAQPFDAAAGRLSGEPRAVAEGVGYDFSAAGNVLAYRTGTSESRQLRWFDRAGRELGKVGRAWDYMEPALSPDGRRVAIGVGSWTPVGDVWLLDVERGSFSRFTTDPKDDSTPIWSPDGSRIAFSSNGKGPFNVYVKDASGAGRDELLWHSDRDSFPQSWSPDGNSLLCVRMDPRTQSDIWTVPIGGGRPSAYLDAAYNEASPAFSPDGKWVAYSSDESGHSEVYVQTFPKSAGKWQVSTRGGDKAQWSRDGRELFYLAPDGKLMAAAVTTTGAGFSAALPAPLFEAPVRPEAITESHSQFAVAADGRILLNSVSDEANAPITVALNWNETPR